MESIVIPLLEVDELRWAEFPQDCDLLTPSVAPKLPTKTKGRCGDVQGLNLQGMGSELWQGVFLSLALWHFHLGREQRFTILIYCEN